MNLYGSSEEGCVVNGTDTGSVVEIKGEIHSIRGNFLLKLLFQNSLGMGCSALALPFCMNRLAFVIKFRFHYHNRSARKRSGWGEREKEAISATIFFREFLPLQAPFV